jgi:hypothetical protein
MFDYRIAPYPVTFDHNERLRASEYARLAQTLETRQPSGFNLYRLVGERLVSWGETLKQAEAHREAVTAPNRRVRTSELPAL